MLLEARQLQKRFGAVVAADDVQISIERGERVSLIGTNGAGKTTFVNMVTGYLKPDSGDIRFDGQEITGHSPQSIARRGLHRSFQIPQLFLQLTLEENVAAALSARDAVSLTNYRDANLEEASSILERFSLADRRHIKAAELPGGVRKLVDIAMAVALRPTLLLLDEPTSGVAADEKYALMDVISTALDGEATTIMFVEHDMDIVRRYSKRVIAFAAGRVLADGSPDHVLADAKVRELVTGERKP